MGVDLQHSSFSKTTKNTKLAFRTANCFFPFISFIKYIIVTHEFGGKFYLIFN